MLITALPSRLANGIIPPQTMSSIITTRSLDPPDTMLGLVVGLADLSRRCLGEDGHNPRGHGRLLRHKSKLLVLKRVFRYLIPFKMLCKGM